MAANPVNPLCIRPDTSACIYQPQFNRNLPTSMLSSPTPLKVPVPFPVAIPIPVEVPVPVYCYVNWPEYNEYNDTNKTLDSQHSVKRNKKYRLVLSNSLKQSKQNVYDNLYNTQYHQTCQN